MFRIWVRRQPLPLARRRSRSRPACRPRPSRPFPRRARDSRSCPGQAREHVDGDRAHGPPPDASKSAIIVQSRAARSCAPFVEADPMPTITLPDGSTTFFRRSPVDGRRRRAQHRRASRARRRRRARSTARSRPHAADRARRARRDRHRATRPEALELLRHDAAHVMAEAVQELFPRRRSPSARRSRTASTTTSRASEPFTPEDLETIEERMREIVARDEPITREVWDRDARRSRSSERMGEPYKAEIIDAHPGGRADHALPPGQLSSTSAAARTCRRPGRLGDGLQADEARRRLLARRLATTRCCSASTAPPGPTQKELEAYLAPARGGGEARPPQARPRDGPVPPAGGGGRARCSGTRRAGRSSACSRTTCARQLDAAGYARSRRRSSSTARSGRRRATGRSSARTCSRRKTADEQVFALKPMNCPGHVQIFKQGIK